MIEEYRIFLLLLWGIGVMFTFGYVISEIRAIKCNALGHMFASIFIICLLCALWPYTLGEALRSKDS